MSMKEELLSERRKAISGQGEAKTDLKTLKEPFKPQSDPTTKINSPDLKSQNIVTPHRMERLERTLSYTVKGGQPIDIVTPQSTVIEPYAPVSRDRHGRYQPGAVGNPRGPEIGIVGHIKLMTNGGLEMADLMIHAMRGFLPYTDPETKAAQWMPIEPKSRLDAMQWLAERGYGKAVQIVQDITKREDDGDLSALSSEEKREYLRLELKRTKALSPGEPMGNGEIVLASDPL